MKRSSLLVVGVLAACDGSAVAPPSDGGGGTSASSASSASSGAGGGSGGSSEVCRAMELVTLSDPSIEDAAMDGVWSPGEMITLAATLESPIENTFYPGLRVTHATAGVTPNPADNSLFGLIANMPNPVPVQLTADAQLAPGTVVTFDLRVFSIMEECPGLDGIQLSATIQ
jgi:hypothetical protein